MKTSNKILLGVLLAFILILTGLHLALYAKYKSGDFVSSKEISGNMEHHSLPDIKYVSITGLTNCYLIAHAGNPSIGIDRVAKSRLSYKVVNDTLIVTGDSTATMEAYERGARNNQGVQLHLPAAAQVKLTYGSLWLSGSYISAHAPSYSIELVTHAFVGIMGHESAITNVFFKQLNLVTNQSTIEMKENVVIDELHVQSYASHLIFHEASIRQMTMNVDSSSTVFMQETNLKSLTKMSTP